MSLWWKNDSHWHHMDTLSDKQQHTCLFYIKHCSLSISLFLFSSMEGKFSKQLKKETLSLKSLYDSCVFFGTSWRQIITEKWQTIHDCLHRKTQLWTVSLWILLFVGVWPEDPINHKHAFSGSASGKISTCVLNPSLDWRLLNVSTGLFYCYRRGMLLVVIYVPSLVSGTKNFFYRI